MYLHARAAWLGATCAAVVAWSAAPAIAADYAPVTITGTTGLVTVGNGVGGSIVTTLPDACATHTRYVPAIGPAGGQYVGTCPDLKWVPARGTEGGHYELRLPSCVRYVPAIGPAGGHYVSTCPNQPKWVPARGLEGGHYATTIGYAALSSPANRTTTASSWGFDWGSAGVGAATMIGALAIALLAITGVRRRRLTGTLTTTTR